MSADLIALDDGVRTWRAADIELQATALAQQLTAQGTRVLATLMTTRPPG